MIGQGDFIQAQVMYTQGALGYTNAGTGANRYTRSGSTAAYGLLSDAVYGGTTVAAANQTSLELTTGWAVDVSYDHNWNRSWKTSLYGGYGSVSYNATANAMLCSINGFGAGTGVGSLAVATAGCSNDWSQWWLGSRTQWTVSQGFYMGVDVLYVNLNSADLPAGALLNNATNPTGTPTSMLAGDRGEWKVNFRIDKSFAP
jgi:hypothetical protein